MRRFIKKLTGRQRRHRRVRARVFGTSERPRLSVFRSSRHLTVQIINDEAGRTLTAAADREIKEEPGGESQDKSAVARKVGQLLAERAVNLGIKMVVFDRGGYAYHGRVKAAAEGARAGGLEF